MDHVDRLERLHARAAELKREQDKRRLRILGSMSTAMMVCLVVAIHKVQAWHHGLLAGQNTGSSLLDDSVGGYVLIAVIAFIIGVIITSVIIRHRYRGQKVEEERKEMRE